MPRLLSYSTSVRDLLNLKKRPNSPQDDRYHGQNEKDAARNGEQPASDMLHTEWAAFQALIREIHRSEEEHKATEHDLGVAQLRTAKGLNRITIVRAAFNFTGLLGASRDQMNCTGAC
jgi:hypothetical protein